MSDTKSRLSDRLRNSVSSLHNRDFRLLWTGTLVSNAGSWMQKVATSWLVYRLTNSELWLGIDAFASGFTTVALLPLGGVIADRVDRRRLLIWTNLICAGLAFTLSLLAAFSMLHVWHIVLVSGLSGIVQAVMVPASTSLLPALVGEKDVPNAIALNSLQFNLSRVVGPAVGGACLVYLGAGWSFALNAVSFLVLAAVFLFIKAVPPVPHEKLLLGQSLLDGVKFVRGRRDLILLLGLVAATGLFGAPVVSLLPALVKNVLGREASAYSLLLSAFGAGAVVAAILTAIFSDHLSHRWIIAIALAVVGASEIALAFSTWYVAVALVIIAGVAFVGTMIQLGTTILQDTPDTYRGRVTSLQQVCFRAGQPLGALIAGSVGRYWGVRASFCVFGGILAAVGFASASISRSKPKQ